MRAAALTGIVIALEDVLANIVFIILFPALVICTDRQRLTKNGRESPLRKGWDERPISACSQI